MQPVHAPQNAVETLIDILLAPITRLFDIQQQTVWISYLGALIVAAVFYLTSRRRRKTSLKGLWRYLFPKRLMRHPSTRLDLKMYLYSSLYLAGQAVILLGGMKGLSAGLLAMAAPVIGSGAPHAPLPGWAIVAVPAFLYLALELGYWLSHYMLHRIDWLWEFHKVHHSAEVMTPLTEWRQHPVEYVIVPVVMGVVSSIALAIVQWGFGPDIELSAFWNPSLILFAFVATYLHLRHSHVNLTATGIWGYIFQSPAHHHIHHSTDPRHFDKNLGFCLSVWDWAFGTLYIPKKGETLTLGLFDEHGHKDELTTSASLWTHMVLPCQRAWKLIRGRKTPEASSLPAE
ncbi:sterol desaturase family protein [Asticcacaulis sp. BYS171W]|uniref:Sterol desaturase family protein n=1 Tax=Asticcacaulis aquaticus TaxID=2984212 RepID=A0ABT5HNU5_9CAUL|nr:sterol desaturase family protein [Asticcacaulis aquaticus]MDC7681735.1 sterol desaturase family protein [Asticcacaulis aquaticus]